MTEFVSSGEATTRRLWWTRQDDYDEALAPPAYPFYQDGAYLSRARHHTRISIIAGISC